MVYHQKPIRIGVHDALWCPGTRQGQYPGCSLCKGRCSAAWSGRSKKGFSAHSRDEGTAVV